MTFEADGLSGASRAAQQVAPWPLYAVLALGAAAVASALLNFIVVSAVTYAVLLLGGVSLLMTYRTQVVRASMFIDGGAVQVVGVERLAVVAIVAGCLANGIVIGLWISSLELWFQ